MIAPKDITTIVRYAQPNRALVFLGPPRCGKSDSVKKGAKLRAEDRGKIFIEYAFRPDMLTKEKIIDMVKNPNKYFLFVDLRLSTKEPYDIEGRLEDDVIKVLDKELDFTRQKAPLWAVLLSIVEGVLFLDELLDVQRPDVKSASYQLLLDKMAGNVKFRDDVLVVVASNTDEYSSLSQGFTLPQAGRCRIFHVRAPTVEEWINFMYERYGNEWDTLVATYLDLYKDSLLKLPVESIGNGDVSQQVYKTETYEAYPSPDTWTQLAISLYHEKELLSHIDLLEYVASFVGHHEAAAFKAFYENTVTVNVDKLLKQPQKVHELDWNQQAAAITQIASRISENIENVIKYKPLIDELVFGKGFARTDFIAILKTCIKKDYVDEKELQPLSKVIPINEFESIRCVSNAKLITRDTIALYVLTLLDNRYDERVTEICREIDMLRRGG